MWRADLRPVARLRPARHGSAEFRRSRSAARRIFGLRKFVLYSLPRTGSTMFTSNISSHPAVRCHGAFFGKVFAVDRPGMFASNFPYWASMADRCSNIEAFLAEVYAASDKFDHVGFKHHLNADARVTAYTLENPDYSRFHITRDNLLATYSSEKLVHRNNRRRDLDAEAASKTKVRFVEDDFVWHMKRRTRIYRRWKPEFDAAGVIEIPYREARTPGGVERVWRALGLDATFESAPRTMKRNSDDLLDRFVNPKAVEAWLVANGRLDWAREA